MRILYKNFLLNNDLIKKQKKAVILKTHNSNPNIIILKYIALINAIYHVWFYSY